MEQDRVQETEKNGSDAEQALEDEEYGEFGGGGAGGGGGCDDDSALRSRDAPAGCRSAGPTRVEIPERPSQGPAGC